MKLSLLPRRLINDSFRLPSRGTLRGRNIAVFWYPV